MSLAIAITYTVAELVAAPSIIAPLWLRATLAVVLAAPRAGSRSSRPTTSTRARTAASRSPPSTRSATSSTRCSPDRCVFLVARARCCRAAGRLVAVLAAGGAGLPGHRAPARAPRPRLAAHAGCCPASWRPRRTLIVGTGDVAGWCERKIDAAPGVRARARRLRGRGATRRRLSPASSGAPGRADRALSTSSRSTG